MPRLPRKNAAASRRPFDSLRRQASADIYAGTESALPATQIEPEVLRCHACHTNPARAAERSRLPRKNAAASRRAFDPLRRQASVDIYAGTESATPVTQIEPEVLKVLRPPPATQNGAASI